MFEMYETEIHSSESSFFAEITFIEKSASSFELGDLRGLQDAFEDDPLVSSVEFIGERNRMGRALIPTGPNDRDDAFFNYVLFEAQIAVKNSPLTGKSLSEIVGDLGADGMMVLALSSGEPITIISTGSGWIIYRVGKKVVKGAKKSFDKDMENVGERIYQKVKKLLFRGR